MASFSGKARTLAELVKFEHTIFALPFAYMGALLACKALPSWGQLFWITMAMVGARSAAMGMNRVIDRTIDGANPRTASRHLPRGLVSVRDVLLFVGVSVTVFVYSVYILSPKHLMYVPLILTVLVGYSYTKRFTYLSHVVLGLAIGMAPLGGWVAVTRELAPESFLLGAVVALWIAGFDIIYATQDVDFDRQYGLYSMPLNLGLPLALRIAGSFHVLVVGLLLLLYFLLGLGWWYLAGVLITGGLLCYEHAIISPRDLSRVNVAFFNVNGIVSIQLLIFTFLDVILK